MISDLVAVLAVGLLIGGFSGLVTSVSKGGR